MHGAQFWEGYGALRTRSPSAQPSSWEPLPTSMGFRDSGAQTDRQASQTLATWSYTRRSCNSALDALSCYTRRLAQEGASLLGVEPNTDPPLETGARGPLRGRPCSVGLGVKDVNLACEMFKETATLPAVPLRG